MPDQNLDLNEDLKSNPPLISSPKFSKKLVFWIAVGLIAVLLGCLSYFLLVGKGADTNLDTQKQFAELDAQRKAANIKPLTEEEIKIQLQELDKQRKQLGVKPLTQEEINKQFEELNKLKNQ